MRIRTSFLWAWSIGAIYSGACVDGDVVTVGGKIHKGEGVSVGGKVVVIASEFSVMVRTSTAGDSDCC
jgi:hypothetical protein